MLSDRGKNAYKNFHGKKPKKVTHGKFHVPTHLIELGDALEITYRCNKWNGGGDGQYARYVHTFSRGTKLYMDERTGKMLYIAGTKLIVTDAGIEN